MIRIKLVNKEGNQALDQFVFIKIPIVSHEDLFNQVYMIKDFGCVFLS